MAAPVVWDIIRRESSFIRKSLGSELSAEPLNIVGKNAFKFSGLAQGKGLGVTVVSVKGKGDKVQLLKKTAKKNSPKKSVSLTYLTHGKPRAAKAVVAVRETGVPVPFTPRRRCTCLNCSVSLGPEWWLASMRWCVVVVLPR